MWYVEKYQADDKKPYLTARIEDFAVLQKMIITRRRDRVEVFAPEDARAADIKKLRALGSVHIQTSGSW
jgi:predicted Ser/Thr protein kinase